VWNIVVKFNGQNEGGRGENRWSVLSLSLTRWRLVLRILSVGADILLSFFSILKLLKLLTLPVSLLFKLKRLHNLLETLSPLLPIDFAD
jgi:hypothetical protein